MKHRDLAQKLRALGWHLAREGSRHEIWSNGELEEPVPRHREIHEMLAKKDSEKGQGKPWEVEMVLEGKIWKDGGYWLIEIPALDLMTQGRSKKEAFLMLEDAVRTLVHRKRFRLKARPYDKMTFLVESNDEIALLALMLKRQRAKHHLTIAQMAKRLHVKSQNAYAQYEQGKSQPSFSKVQEFLTAMNSHAVMAFTVLEATAPYGKT